MLNQRHRPMANINIVPYIDVMLVLLIIFMVTVPLIQQGVEIELPKADAESMDDQDQIEPLIVTVNRSGQFFLNQGQNANQVVSKDSLLTQAKSLIATFPQAPVYVRGDRNVAYEHVMTAMVLLQTAGASSIGLITQPPQN